MKIVISNIDIIESAAVINKIIFIVFFFLGIINFIFYYNKILFYFNIMIFFYNGLFFIV